MKELDIVTGLPDGEDSDMPATLFRSTVTLLAELAAISSPSGDTAGLGRMAARLGAELAARGWSFEIGDDLVLVARRDEPDDHGDTGEADKSARRDEPATGGRPGPLVLIGHMDTVLPAAPPHLAAAEERLVATGAIDMKGGLATLLGALDLLAHRGAALPANLRLVAVPDEEVGGELSRNAVARWGAEARALWVLEPGEPGRETGAETLVGGRRGMFDWHLTATGTAAHSGLHFAHGRSALLATARWALAAAAPPGAPATEDQAPTVNVGRLVAGDASFVGKLAETHGWLGTDRQLNVVPDRAVAEGEVRVSRAAQADEEAARLASLADEIGAATGTRLTFTRGATIPPVDPHGPQRAWCARAVALAEARGWSLEVEEERGGISFPNFLTEPGRIPVLDGLGPIGGGMHTRDEFVDLRSLRRRIVLLADLLQAEAGQQPTSWPRRQFTPGSSK
jgi:glutamate carboxypeptidase